MKKIKIMLEFAHSPVWVYNEDEIPSRCIPPIISKDQTLTDLANSIEDLYHSYYEFDSHGVACWFNTEQERRDKDKMLSLLTRLVERLHEINDGSYVIEDLESERVRAL